MIKIMRYFVRMALSVFVLACCTVNMHALDKSYYAATSKLAEGSWVKIAVKESGIYQITADDIRSWGLGGDLSKIHVFGYGGKPLSETMLGDNYADDLPQMPIVRTGDRILFYAQGPVTWKHKGTALEQVQVQHPYALTGSYFVTNDDRFTDIATVKADNDPSGELFSTYTERLYHELEIINPGETGRAFLGDDFKSNRHQTFKFDLSGKVAGSQVKSYMMFGARTPNVNSTVSSSYNGKPLPVTDADLISAVNGVSHVHYYLNGQSAGSIKTFNLDDTDELNYTLDYSCNGTVELARLDFLTINFERNLALRKGHLAFGLQNANSGNCYRVSECGSATHVWNVTEPFAIVEMKTTSSGDGTVIFSPQKSGRQEFVAFDESGTFSHPEFVAEIANQDIHGEPIPDEALCTLTELVQPHAGRDSRLLHGKHTTKTTTFVGPFRFHHLDTFYEAQQVDNLIETRHIALAG